MSELEIDNELKEWIITTMKERVPSPQEWNDQLEALGWTERLRVALRQDTHRAWVMEEQGRMPMDRPFVCLMQWIVSQWLVKPETVLNQSKISQQWMNGLLCDESLTEMGLGRVGSNELWAFKGLSNPSLEAFREMLSWTREDPGLRGSDREGKPNQEDPSAEQKEKEKEKESQETTSSEWLVDHLLAAWACWIQDGHNATMNRLCHDRIMKAKAIHDRLEIIRDVRGEGVAQECETLMNHSVYEQDGRLWLHWMLISSRSWTEAQWKAWMDRWKGELQRVWNTLQQWGKSEDRMAWMDRLREEKSLKESGVGQWGWGSPRWLAWCEQHCPCPETRLALESLRHYQEWSEAGGLSIGNGQEQETGGQPGFQKGSGALKRL